MIFWFENQRPKPKPHGGLDDVPRDPVPFIPPLPAPPRVSRSGEIVARNYLATTESETAAAQLTAPPVARLRAIKRMADVDWAGMIQEDLPLYGDW
jgi:hypothetical protein